MVRTCTSCISLLTFLFLVMSSGPALAQCFCTISQGGTTLPFDPLVGTTDAITWIDYNAAGLSSSNTGIEQADALMIALYEDQFGQYTLALTLDLQNDGAGGSENITVSCVNDGAFIAFANENDEASGAPPTFTGNFAWGPPNNDGMFIGGITCPMTITIEAGFEDGISGAAFATGDAAAPNIIGLPGTGLITIDCGGGACCPTPLVNDVFIQNASCPTSTDGAVVINDNTLSGIPPFTYIWDNFNGFENELMNVGPGTYCVTVMDSQGCEEVNCYTIFASNPAPPINPAGPLYGCTDPLTGFALFDLTTLNNAIGGGLGTTVLWYQDEFLFLPINTPGGYLSDGFLEPPFGDVFAVVNNGICNSEPIAIDLIAESTLFAAPTSLEECEESNGEATFDLTAANDNISGGIGLVTWYEDAAGNTPIADPANYTTTTTIVYAGLVNNETVGMCETEPVEVQLTVLPAPTGTPDTIESCVTTMGMAEFDLSSVTADVNDDNGSLLWYEDSMQVTQILDTTSFMSDMDTVFAFITLDGCISAPIPVYLNPIIVNPGPTDSLSVCDDGAGTGIFDLSSLEAGLIGSNDAINWFEDAVATVPIATPGAYSSNTTTVFYTLTDDGCSSGTTPVDLTTLPRPLVQTDTIIACNQGDGTGTFNLDTAMIITNGVGTLSWYEDAAGTIPIVTTSAYPSAPGVVYVQATEGTCSSPIIPVELELVTLVTAMSDTIALCGDGAGIATFDLTTLEANISGGTGTVNWYEDDLGTIPIADPANFTSASTTVYVDVTLNDCGTPVVPVTVTVIPLPVANTDTQSACADTNGIATFDLTASDATVSGGNGTVNWYIDANATVAVTTPDSFTTSTDIDVYATVFDGTCTSLPVAVMLDVLPLPQTQPDTLISCDNGNGIAVFDLTSANVTTTPGTTIAWFEDAAASIPISMPDMYNSLDNTVYAVVTLGACSAPVVAVELEAIIAQAPAVGCTFTSPDSVAFSWNITAASYSVTYQLNAGPVIGPFVITDTQFGVGGLVPGDEIMIEVTSIIDPLCTSGITGTASCTATICPVIDFTYNLVNAYCSDESPFLLVGTPPGGVFSGPGVSGDTLYPGLATGPQVITYEYFDSTLFCAYQDTVQITVFEPLDSVMLDCSAITVNDITFSWNDVGADAYQLDLVVGGTAQAPLTTTSLDTTISGLSELTDVMITVTPLGAPPCGNGPASSITCTTDPCPPTTISSDFIDAIFCSDTSAILLPDLYPGGVYSGSGVTGNQFNPGAVGTSPAILSFSYTDTLNGCSYVLNDTVEVVDPLPIPVISCGTLTPNSVQFIWEGGNPDGYQYYYQIENDPATPVTISSDTSLTVNNISDQQTVTIFVSAIGQFPCGDSPYDSLSCVSAPCPDVPLSIDNLAGNYCSSTAPFTLMATPPGGTFTGPGVTGDTFDPNAAVGINPVNIVYEYTDTATDCYYIDTFFTSVSDTLLPPLISCELSTPSSVSFSWEDAGSSAYFVSWTIDGLPGGDTTLSATTLSILNLLPEQDVAITVIALGTPPCGDAAPSTATCSSAPCPVVSFEFTAPFPLCSEDGIIQLDVNVIGSSPTGTITWAGDGIEADTGAFNTDIAIVGDNNITITYEDGVCLYDTMVTVNVHPEPMASFTANGSFCSDSTLILTFDGMATDSATLNWLLDGGTIVQTLPNNTLEVSWPAPGNYTPALVIEDNGCVSDTFSLPVELIAPLIPPVISCEVLNYTSIDFSWNAVEGADSYQVTTSAGVGSLNDTTYSVTGLMPGDTATVTVTAIGTTPCGTVTSVLSCNTEPCPDISFEFTAPSPVCSVDGPIALSVNVINSSPEGTTSWSGDGITSVDGTFDPTSAIIGDNMVTITYDEEGVCTFDTTVIVYVHPEPVASFTVDGSFCSDSTLILTFDGMATDSATLNWLLDGGTIVQTLPNNTLEVSWPAPGNYTPALYIEDNGCNSDTFSLPVELIAPLIPPVISCEVLNYTSIDFSWNAVEGADSYQVTTSAGVGSLNDTTYSVTGLMPGDTATVTVTAIGTTPCGTVTSVLSCNTEPCPDISFEFTAPSPVCSVDGPIALSVNVINSSPEGTTSWSGDGITSVDGTFDPTSAIIGDNMVTITYDEEGVCTFDTTVIVYVHPEPVASFTVDGSFCSDSTLILTFDGMATDSATLNWLLDGGTIVQTLPNNTLEVSWPAPGNYTPALYIEDNGCNSDTFSLPVELIAPLIPPVISCEVLNYTSIDFSWNAVEGADSYQVTTSAGVGFLNDTTYSVTGLMPGDTATVTVTAIGTTPCGPVTSVLSCNTEPCPDISFEFTAPSPVCSEDGPITLTVNVINSSPEGTILWSGDGTAANGTFDPMTAVVGDNMVTVTYDEEGVCTFDSTFIVYVHPEPVASFTVDGSFCADSTLILTFDGMATDSATLNWLLDGGSIVQTLPNNTLEVSWPAPGNYTPALVIEDNGCVSDTFSLPVELIAPLTAPVITCEAINNTTIEFSWDPVEGANSYQVTTSAGTGTLNGTTYTVSGLLPEESTTVMVTAIGTTPCGTVSSELECSTPPCPEVLLSLDAPDDICAGETVDVEFTITGVPGTFEIAYQINAGDTVTTSLSSGESLSFPNTVSDFELSVISFFASANTACVYPGGQAVQTQVMIPPVAGVPANTPALCVGTDSLLQLISLLEGADAGGSWALVSPASAPGFDANAGTLASNNLTAGTYEFSYSLSGDGICPDASASVSVVINGLPAVDAGETQEISCNMGMVSLGSASNPTGSGTSYLWTSESAGVVINNPTDQFIDVGQPGTYLLTITNEFGCSSSDEVVVTASLDAPVGFITATPPTCFGEVDAFINIDSIIGGTPPYTIYLDDVPYGNQTSFFNLAPGSYTVTLEGTNGCQTQQLFDLPEPPQLTAEISANLDEDRTLVFGDSTLINVTTNNVVPIDTFIWLPEGQGASFWAQPNSTATYSVTVIDENGCTAEDEILIFVEKIRDVFVPNVFSPNDDGRNDIFYIQSGPQVVNIESFLIFNRWGETIFEQTNIPANDPLYGWDGRFRGELMNAAVFTWFAEIEFLDGEVTILKGDVTLLR
jgi:gliding motility-associated-like protein